LIDLIVFITLFSFPPDSGSLGSLESNLCKLACNAPVSSGAAFEARVASDTVETAPGFLPSESAALSVSNVSLLFSEECFEVRNGAGLDLVFNSRWESPFLPSQ
jgi:hypothetical protein